MVFDIPTPLPMSIFDNVAYGLRINKKQRANKRQNIPGRSSVSSDSDSLQEKNDVTENRSIADCVESALRMAVLWDDVKDRLRVSAMSLSGGQQQRLCIARVLALDPEVILLDRPCSGLDPISTANIEDSLMQLKEQLTIVIAPHNVQQAARISDRVAFMLMGELVEEGASSDIFSNPRDERTSNYITGRFG
jgi:phosphate transport system ATP-binding protein